MIEVEIKNFQAIDDLKLAVEGFTALVGRSNIGKSSIVRALKCALSGSSGTDFVRHDARACPRISGGSKTCRCFASVKLSFGDGQAILWEKGGRGVNRYTVWRDGVASVYDRVGQHVDLPDFLEAHLAPVKIADSLLQVSSQFEAPFLLNLSGPAVASILSDIGQLDDINQALAAAAKDRRAAGATRKVREGDVEVISGRLRAYAGWDAHAERVRGLQARSREVETHVHRIQLAERLITGVLGAAAMVRRLAAVAELQPPEPRRVVEISRRSAKAKALVDAVDTRVKEVHALKSALAPQLPDPAILAFVRAVAIVQRLERATASAAPSTLPDLQRMASDLRRVEVWASQLAELGAREERGRALQRVTVPVAAPLGDGVQRLREASRLLVRLDRAEREVRETESLVELSARDAAAVAREFAELGVCPTCHQGLTPEHVLHAS